MLLTENMHDVFVVEGDNLQTVHANIKKYTERMKEIQTIEGEAPKVYFSGVNDHESVPMVCFVSSE